MSHTIEVVPYNPKWPGMFESEAELIKQAMGSNCIAIYHIGSTSVPSLSAKPIIDILPVVKDIQEVDHVIKAMENLGYDAKGEYGIPFRRHFSKGITIRTHNVHTYEIGNPEIDRHLKFRDWMRSHEEDAKAYEMLKIDLAQKYPDDMMSYTLGKEAFISNIIAKSGFKGVRICQALTDPEWTAVRHLRQQYLTDRFFGPDSFTWTFENKEHIHFVFYSETKIIGYAHIQLMEERKAALRMIVIDEPYRNLGYGSQLLKLCERWLTLQNFEKLQLISTQKAHKFFATRGYELMLFNDPDIYEPDIRDIEMGKVLL